MGNTSTDDLVELYNVIMTSLLDKHCPVVKARRRVKPSTPSTPTAARLDGVQDEPNDVSDGRAPTWTGRTG